MKNPNEWRDVQTKEQPVDPNAPKLEEFKGGMVMSQEDVKACTSRLPAYRPGRK